jgi:hypothetical protein
LRNRSLFHRRITSILLASLVVLTLGAHLFYEGSFVAAKLHFRALAFFTDPEEFVPFSAPNSEIQWNGEDEFTYKGRLYDAVNITTHQDSIFCRVYEDGAEQNAFDGLMALYGPGNDQRTPVLSKPHTIQDQQPKWQSGDQSITLFFVLVPPETVLQGSPSLMGHILPVYHPPLG